MYHSDKDDFLRDFAQRCAARGETLLEFGTPQTYTIDEVIELYRAYEQAAQREMKKAAEKAKKSSNCNRPMSSYQTMEDAIAANSSIVKAVRDFVEKHLESVSPVIVKSTPGEKCTLENARIAIKRCMESDPVLRAHLLELTRCTERNREQFGEFRGKPNKCPAPNKAICKAFNLSEIEYLIYELRIYHSIVTQALKAFIFVQWPNEGFMISEKEFLPWLREIEAAQCKA